ncbi:MAG TPA: hypothetical protein VFS08_04225 [Gemmatimonadaceae bacterium]|nr:hypothetical protein [Gemmatimonadaceae bacterium]
MSLLLLIPDGVGVRNFLREDFLRRAVRTGPVDVLHPIPSAVTDRYPALALAGVRAHELREGPGPRLAALLRASLAYAQMYWADTQSMRFARRVPVRGGLRARALYGAARVIGAGAAWPGGLRALDRWHCAAAAAAPEVAHYQRLLETLRPRVLFCSHQRPVGIVPPVLAARTLGIPTATFIFSWDNLTSKGRIAAPFDHYLVWSEHMRGELLRYYPDVRPAQVHVVGTPQFDPYVDDTLLWSREEFCARIGADPARPLVCYSGGDAGTTPEDAAHVAALLEQIRAGRVRGRPQVLLRPSPVDPGARFDEVRARYPELLYARPQWLHTQPGNWARVLPLPEDTVFLANLTRHADVNVNLASTMTIDFALRDKPVVNVAFDVADPPPFPRPLWEYYYRFEHYRPVVELGAARFAHTPDELGAYVDAYLRDPSLDRDARRRLVELEVGAPVGTAGTRILEALGRIAA